MRPRSSASASSSGWPRAPLTTSAAPPPTGPTRSACSRAARSGGPGTSTGEVADATQPQRQRRAARGRRRLGGGEPPLRAARAARVPRLQERLRAGRVRLVLRLPRRRARLLLPGARGPGRGPRGGDGRGHSRRRGPAPRAGGLCRGGRGAVRVLHPRAHSRNPRPARPQPGPHRRGDKGGPRGQPLPLHRIREDPRRRSPRLREDGVSTPPRLVIEGCAVATVTGDEYASGHLVVEGESIAAVGDGPAPREYADDPRIDGSGSL